MIRFCFGSLSIEVRVRNFEANRHEMSGKLHRRQICLSPLERLVNAAAFFQICLSPLERLVNAAAFFRILCALRLHIPSPAKLMRVHVIGRMLPVSVTYRVTCQLQGADLKANQQ